MKSFLLILIFLQLIISTSVFAKDKDAELFASKCSSCHSLSIITSKTKTEKEWQAVSKKMVSYGAKISSSEINTIAKYLASLKK